MAVRVRWVLVRVIGIMLTITLIGGCIPIEDDAATPPPDDDPVIDDPVDGETALVVDVIDGDTIEVRMRGDTYRVRYIGVNTPEYDEPCYDQATAANAVLVDGQTVTLVRDVSDTDRYDRLLRYVYVGAVFVNAELVAQGYAESRRYPPDTGYQTYFDDLEREARRTQIGCYPTGVFD